MKTRKFKVEEIVSSTRTITNLPGLGKVGVDVPKGTSVGSTVEVEYDEFGVTVKSVTPPSHNGDGERTWVRAAGFIREDGSVLVHTHRGVCGIKVPSHWEVMGGDWVPVIDTGSASYADLDRLPRRRQHVHYRTDPVVDGAEAILFLATGGAMGSPRALL